jgi:hypothetical protein
MRIKAGLIGFYLIISSLGIAQVNPFDIKKYDFIDYEVNQITTNDNPYFDAFYSKLDTLILLGHGKINIIHIGDSHIQADYISGQLRKRFQEMAWGLNGGRGFVFPVQIAKTNNPWNYRVKYSGSWEVCKNVEHRRNCELGLAGFLVETKSEKASVHLTFTDKEYPQYHFTSLRVYHNMDTANWDIQLMDTTVQYQVRHVMDSAYTQLIFESEQNYLDIEFLKKSEIGTFVLHGFSFDNDDPGIVYHSLGVNGAEVESWLKCPKMISEIQTLHPDLIIISLGTNDSYTSKFNDTEFETNVRRLLARMEQAAPNAAILWVTPGDNYRYRRYLNYSTSKASEVILKVAKEEQIMVWDFYDIMGELNAIMNWSYAGLVAKDRLHYNKQGYELQGNLLFNAFLKSYNDHIEKQE